MLAHNGAFEFRWLISFLGQKLFYDIFNAQSRDSMTLAIALNDMAVNRGDRLMFERVSLEWLCTHFGIKNERAHDAYYDALACAQVYRKLLSTEFL